MSIVSRREISATQMKSVRSRKLHVTIHSIRSLVNSNINSDQWFAWPVHKAHETHSIIIVCAISLFAIQYAPAESIRNKEKLIASGKREIMISYHFARPVMFSWPPSQPNATQLIRIHIVWGGASGERCCTKALKYYLLYCYHTSYVTRSNEMQIHRSIESITCHFRILFG